MSDDQAVPVVAYPDFENIDDPFGTKKKRAAVANSPVAARAAPFDLEPLPFASKKPSLSATIKAQKAKLAAANVQIEPEIVIKVATPKKPQPQPVAQTEDIPIKSASTFSTAEFTADSSVPMEDDERPASSAPTAPMGYPDFENMDDPFGLKSYPFSFPNLFIE